MKNSMNPKDAAKILNVSGVMTPELVKTAYRKACAKYHPDRNPAGHEMMKLVNQAYDALKDYEDDAIELTEDSLSYGDELNAALMAVMGLGLTIELCGAWVWLSGDTKPHKDIIKEAGYKWASKKKSWYFRPADYKSSSRGKFSMDDIRSKYGAKDVYGSKRPQLTA